jgi:CRISPR-associated protein Csc1
VTPATITGEPRFSVEQFNAQPDSYWFAMGNNALIVKPDGWDAEPGAAWYLVNRSNRNERRKVGTNNRPQIGMIKMLGIGTHARFYLLNDGESWQPPRYIRLGKWMSKARLEASEVRFRRIEAEQRQVAPYLNPVDFAQGSRLLSFDLLSIHPAPLVRNSTIAGAFYELEDSAHSVLPADMRFGVEAIIRGN